MSSRASTALLFLFPLTAAAAAWERCRRDRWPQGASTTVRPPLVVAAEALAPTAAVALGGYALALGVSRFEGDAVDLVVVGVSLAWLGAACVVGWSLGGHGAPAVVVPAMLVLGFIWMAFPAAWEPLWLRHLNGAWFTCCRTGQARSDLAAAAGVLTAFGVSSAALAVRPTRTHSQSRTGLRARAARPALGLAGLTSLVLAMIAASGHGPDPAVARPAAQLTCTTRSTVQVCVWPEHQQAAPIVAEVAGEAVELLPALGATTPVRFSEAEGVADGVPFGTAPWAGRREITVAVAVGVAQWCAGEIPPLELEFAILGLLDAEVAGEAIDGDEQLSDEVARVQGDLVAGDLICPAASP